MTNENQKVTMKNGSTIEFVGDCLQIKGVENNVMLIPVDLQDLILTKEDLKEIKVLDKPTDTATRIIWIIRTIAYEYGRGEKGCCVPLREIGLMAVFGKEEIQELINILKRNYKCNLILNKELIGHCLEIVWG